MAFISTPLFYLHCPTNTRVISQLLSWLLYILFTSCVSRRRWVRLLAGHNVAEPDSVETQLRHEDEVELVQKTDRTQLEPQVVSDSGTYAPEENYELQPQVGAQQEVEETHHVEGPEETGQTQREYDEYIRPASKFSVSSDSEDIEASSDTEDDRPEGIQRPGTSLGLRDDEEHSYKSSESDDNGDDWPETRPEDIVRPGSSVGFREDEDDFENDKTSGDEDDEDAWDPSASTTEMRESPTQDEYDAETLELSHLRRGDIPVESGQGQDIVEDIKFWLRIPASYDSMDVLIWFVRNVRILDWMHSRRIPTCSAFNPELKLYSDTGFAEQTHKTILDLTELDLWGLWLDHRETYSRRSAEDVDSRLKQFIGSLYTVSYPPEREPEARPPPKQKVPSPLSKVTTIRPIPRYVEMHVASFEKEIRHRETVCEAQEKSYKRVETRHSLVALRLYNIQKKLTKVEKSIAKADATIQGTRDLIARLIEKNRAIMYI